MSDRIILTITPQEVVTTVTMTPQEIYSVSFLNVASVDPRVAQARNEAQTAAAQTQLIADGISSNGIIYALIFG